MRVSRSGAGSAWNPSRCSPAPTTRGLNWPCATWRIGESVANIDSVCLACAGPVGAADFRFTNNHWVINRAAFRGLGLDHLLLVNDFSTMAWAASRLGADELVQVRAGSAERIAPG